MDDKTTTQLDRLLAGGEISGPEADAILERVLARVEHDAPRGRMPGVLVRLGAIAAAAAAAVFALVGTGVDDAESPPAFAARGGSGGGGLQLAASCSDGPLEACPLSAKLVFSVSGDASSGFLSAYAEALEPGGERVWYFSRDAVGPELTSVSDGTRVFDDAVRLSGTHRPGRYRVHAFLCDHPLSRDEMLAGEGASGVLTAASVELTVVEE